MARLRDPEVAARRQARPEEEEAGRVLETTFAQLRFVASVVFGVPFSLRALDRLVDAALETQREFGAVGPEANDLLGGPTLDEQDRRAVQLRRFRAQAARAARETTYYRALFERLGLDPRRLGYDDIARVPLTPKEALREDPDAFVRRSARPSFRTTTTGTTGRPTSVCFSDHEMRTYSALAAVSLLTQGRLAPEDVVQVSTSARATLGNTCFAAACARVGALWYLTGIVDPELALAPLAEARRLPGKKPRASQLTTYASYLGQLVECGTRLGYRPADFGLERISVGGEVVTAGLKERARQLFGPVAFDEGYAMTETWPLAGTPCSEGHLHFDVSQALVEVWGLDGDGPAAPGEPGTIVATPFPPYRDTTIVLRYDTEDVVRPLAGPLTCNLRHLPATTDLLGKRRLSIRHDGPVGWTFVRDVAEALESLDVAGAVPLPARYGFSAVPGGVAVEALIRPGSDTPSVRHAIAQRLESRGVPLRSLRLVDDPRHLERPVPLRCDLREVSFTPATPNPPSTTSTPLSNGTNA